MSDNVAKNLYFAIGFGSRNAIKRQRDCNRLARLTTCGRGLLLKYRVIQI